jgi:cysteine-rich secretory family protein
MPSKRSTTLIGTCLAGLLGLLLARPLSAQPTLGDPPRAPTDVSGLPGGPSPDSVTGGFSVNTDAREEVRQFYNAVYFSSEGLAMNSSADTANCVPGTNATAFQEGVLRRINWFRAMAGIPASVTLNTSNNTNDQAAALMMSANNALSHYPPSTWSCFSGPGAHAASNSNLALGSSGSQSITRYIEDYGANNTAAGHRRWILYPQTQVMGTGDVPDQGTNSAANATWVFDANLFGPRPSTRQPYVAWPPEGFVPYPVVFPQWSFALSNADFSTATVSMLSNGVSVAVSIQPYATGYGEDTLLWVPMGLDATSPDTVFPFDGADTTYAITVGNIKSGAATFSYSYSVTVFDPAVPGAGYIPTTVSGPTQAVVSAANAYTCAPPANPHVTSYQWRTSQLAPGNLTDGAEGGLVNFTASVSPGYSTITTAIAASGTHSFYLAHPVPATAQVLQLNRILLAATNTTLKFKSLLGYATAGEVARVQVSPDNGGTWQDVYTQPGTGGAGESSFNLRTVSLSNYVGQATLLRFNYDFVSGSYYTNISPGVVGWSLDDIVLTNVQQLVNSTTNTTPSANFTFSPAQTGSYTLEAQPVIFTEFGLGWGPIKTVTAISNSTPTLQLSVPVVSSGQVRLDFSVSPSSMLTFKLLQADQVTAAWTTNSTATLTTNVAGSSYRFTTPVGPAVRFYRVQTP